MNGHLNLVNCHYTKKLINNLRPSYKIPDVYELLKDVLPDVQKKYVNSVSNFQSTGVLLVSKSKTNNLVDTIFN